MGLHQSLRGTEATGGALDLGQMDLYTDTERVLIGGLNGNIEIATLGPLADYTLYVATVALGGRTRSAGATGRALVDSTTTGTTANKLVDSGASFTSAHLNKTVYNSTDDTQAKVTVVDSPTQLTLDTDITVSGDNYVIADAFSLIQEAYAAITGSFGVSIMIKGSSGIFREDIDLIGKNATGPFDITFEGTRVNTHTGTATAGANPAGNGSAGYGTLTDSGAAWTISEHQDNFVEITSGTGSGQIMAVHDNTATVATIVGRWDTVPDATSVYRFYTCETRITGADIGAETTVVRDYCFKLDRGQKGIIFKHLRLDYAGNANGEAIILGIGSSGCEAWYCILQGSGFWNIQISSGSTFKWMHCVSLDATIGDIRCDTSAVTTMIRGCRLTNSGNRGIDASALGSIFSLYETYINVTTGNGVLVSQNGLIDIDAYLEVDSSPSHNFHAFSGGVVFSNGLFGARTTTVSKNSSAWGFFAEKGGMGDSVQGITYSGNASGTFTPVTAIVGGTD